MALFNGLHQITFYHINLEKFQERYISNDHLVIIIILKGKVIEKPPSIITSFELIILIKYINIILTYFN